MLAHEFQLVGRAFLFFDVPLALSCCSPVVAPDCALGWPIWAMSLRYLAPRRKWPSRRPKFCETSTLGDGLVLPRGSVGVGVAALVVAAYQR